jgi:hypothetical protein
VHDCKREARIYSSSFYYHRAGPALTVVAALFGAGQMESFSKHVQQGGAVIDIERNSLPIDYQVYLAVRRAAVPAVPMSTWRRDNSIPAPLTVGFIRFINVSVTVLVAEAGRA